MALRNIPMTMADWEIRLDGFLTLMDHEVLKDKGRISAEEAKLHAETEFEKYRIIQDRLFQSDFDKFIELEGTAKEIEGT
ncbi:Virulence protein RhuM family protein [Butyrivibrio sp. YAB3001]|nr:Virulence protein RhuM family protein [Butyrivibrio sp. YAB3001]